MLLAAESVTELCYYCGYAHNVVLKQQCTYANRKKISTITISHSKNLEQACARNTHSKDSVKNVAIDITKLFLKKNGKGINKVVFDVW